MLSTNNWSRFIFACVAVLTIYSAPTRACTCLRAEAQDIYCKSDYVILADIVSTFPHLDGRTAFQMEIRRTFKNTTRGHSLLSDNILLTSSKDNPCALDLELNKMYVIASDQDELDACTYAQLYKTMSKRAKRELRKLPKTRCRLPIPYSIPSHW